MDQVTVFKLTPILFFLLLITTGYIVCSLLNIYTFRHKGLYHTHEKNLGISSYDFTGLMLLQTMPLLSVIVIALFYLSLRLSFWLGSAGISLNNLILSPVMLSLPLFLEVIIGGIVAVVYTASITLLLPLLLLVLFGLCEKFSWGLNKLYLKTFHKHVTLYQYPS